MAGKGKLECAVILLRQQKSHIQIGELFCEYYVGSNIGFSQFAGELNAAISQVSLKYVNQPTSFQKHKNSRPVFIQLYFNAFA